MVLVDDPTQHVATADVAERQGSRGHFAERCWHLESKAAVRPMLVVMPDVVAKDGFEMVTAENERPVETLFTYGPYPALRCRVRAGRSDGCLEHLVKAGGELRVAVSDQEPERPTVLGEISGEVGVVQQASFVRWKPKVDVNVTIVLVADIRDRARHLR